jgi:hypothetical protein
MPQSLKQDEPDITTRLVTRVNASSSNNNNSVGQSPRPRKKRHVKKKKKTSLEITHPNNSTYIKQYLMDDFFPMNKRKTQTITQQMETHQNNDETQNNKMEQQPNANTGDISQPPSTITEETEATSILTQPMRGIRNKAKQTQNHSNTKDSREQSTSNTTNNNNKLHTRNQTTLDEIETRTTDPDQIAHEPRRLIQQGITLQLRKKATWGSSIANPPYQSFRVFFQNINGLKVGQSSETWKIHVKFMKEMKINISGLAETNTN